MFTPPGVGGRSPVRRERRRAGTGTLVVVVLLTAALVAAAWWWSLRSDQPTVASPPRTCVTTPPPATVVSPTAITVNVYNATARKGLAGTVATELRKRGFHVGRIDNDPLKRHVTGAAEVRSSTAGADAARTVAAQVGSVVAGPDQRKDASVDLVLGATFRALRPVAAATAALSPTPRPVQTTC